MSDTDPEVFTVMRDAYHEELDGITASLVEMTSLVGSAVGLATTALLDAGLDLAERVIMMDNAIDTVYRSVEQRALELMARQQPVASDLRTIVATLRMVADLERSGDYAVHLAKIARRRYPTSPIPPELRSTMLEMGQVAERIVAKAGSVIASHDLDMAAELERDDDVMDGLHRKLFEMILDPDWPHSTEATVDITLAGRYYERFADHAVAIARRVHFLVTGDRVLS